MIKKPIQAYLNEDQHKWLDDEKARTGVKKTDILSALVNAAMKKKVRK